MVVTSIPNTRCCMRTRLHAPGSTACKARPLAPGPGARVRARFFQRLADHDVVDEFEVRWKGNGEPLWAVLSGAAAAFSGRDAMLTAFTPINVLKVMEQRLELWAKVSRHRPRASSSWGRTCTSSA